jgi:uncharacterized membrane protein
VAGPRIVEFEGKQQEFPADATDAEISAALGAIPRANAPQAPKAKTWTDVVVNAIPAVAGTAGAVIGGIGGTAFGMGVGGIPGSAGGAALGTAGGEAAKQLINRARGADAPSTSAEAAKDIALPAAEAGVSTALFEGAGHVLRPYAGTILQKVGSAMESPQSIRQMAGKAVTAAGKLVDAAPTPAPSAAPRMVLDASDVTKIRELMKAGMPQGDAVKMVWNLKVKNIVAGWKP